MRAMTLVMILLLAGCAGSANDGAETSGSATDGLNAKVTVRFDEASRVRDVAQTMQYGCLDLEIAPQTLGDLAVTLPEPRSSPIVAWDERDCAQPGCPGGCAYILGGRATEHGDEPHTTDILRYNPDTGLLRKMSSKLPTPLAAGAAVWLDDTAYLFGGSTYTFDGPASGTYDGRPILYTDHIISYDPATGEVAQLEDRLPSGRTRASAIVFEDHAYAFGGYPYTDEIVRFGADGVEVLDTRLPTPRSKTAAFFDPTITAACPVGCAYIVGGQDSSGYLDQVLRFEPSSGTVTITTAKLPTARISMQAVWHHGAGYILGGWDGGRLDQILRFDDGAITVQEARIPTARSSLGAFSAGHAVMIVGGKGDGDVRYSDILAYSPVLEHVLDLGDAASVADLLPRKNIPLEKLDIRGTDAPLHDLRVPAIRLRDVAEQLPALPLDFRQSDLGIGLLEGKLTQWAVIQA